MRITLEEAITSNAPLWRLQRRRGRPTVFTAELAVRLCLQMAAERNLAAACAEAGISRSTVYSWITRFPDFARFYRGTRRLMELRGERCPAYSSQRQRRRQRIVTQLNARVSSVGRPSVYRPQLANLVRPTNRGTARAVGVTERTIETWRSRYSDFDRAARLSRLGKELPDIRKRADDLLERGRRAGLMAEYSDCTFL